jgi:hypothetical protein
MSLVARIHSAVRGDRLAVDHSRAETMLKFYWTNQPEFTSKQVLHAISEMKLSKAPGYDGFSAEFYQKKLECYLMALFSQLQKGELPLYKLNFGVITLLPKKENAMEIQQYRPICLLNVSFKIFTKVVTNRITDLSQKVIRPTQTAFMPGRHILEGVVILHETTS